MAKKDKSKKSKKAKKPAIRLRAISETIEANGLDTAHKIWLAGVGAYGKAYDVAAENFSKVSDQSAEVFDDLVKRGEVIENDVRERIEKTEAYSRVSDQIGKVGKQLSKTRGRVNEATEDLTDSVSKFQDEQRERLEARMERMRDALGLTKGGSAKKSEKFHSKLDKLEEEVASLRATAGAIDAKVRSRVERLANEIAAFAGIKSDVPAAKPAEKKAKKKPAEAVKTAAKPKAKTSKKPAATPKARAPKVVEDDLRAIKGVGPVMEAKLKAAGISGYEQLATLTEAETTALEDKLGTPGIVTRGDWKAQASALLK